MNRTLSVSFSLACVSFGLGVLGTHSTGSIFPALPLGMAVAICFLAIPLLVSPDETPLLPYVLSVVLFAVGYRVYVFLFPASMVGLDPDGVAVTVQQIIEAGTLAPLQTTYFYNTAPVFHVYITNFSLVSGLPANDAFVVLSIAMGVLMPTIAALVTIVIFGHSTKRMAGIAALLGSIGSTSLVFSYSVNAQTAGIILMYLVLYLIFAYFRKPTNVGLALLVGVLAIIIFAHKLPVFLVVLLTGSYVGLDVALRFVPRDIVRTPSLRAKTGSSLLFVIASLMLYLQWGLVTTYIRSTLSKILVLLNRSRLPSSNSVELTAAEGIYSGPEDILLRYGYGFVLLIMAGIGWMYLLYSRSDDPPKQFLLAGSAIAAVLTAATIIAPGVATPQRILSYTEVMFIILATVVIVSLLKRPNLRSKVASGILLLLVISSQLFAPLAAPDYPSLRPTVYLDQQEVDGKEHIRQYVNDDVYTDLYYAKETIPSTFDEGEQSNRGFKTISGGLVNGSLVTANHSYVLLRDTNRILFTPFGVVRLTEWPEDELDVAYNEVYDNGNVSLYTRV